MKTINKIALLFMLVTALLAGFNSRANAQSFTVVSLIGSVYDASTHDPISVNLTLYDENNKKITTTLSNQYEGGAYIFTGLTPGKKYFVVINQPGYFKEKILVTVPPTDRYVEINVDILVKPLKIGTQIPVSVSPFEPHKSKVRPGADEYLAQWLGSLSNNPTVKFEIRCYADNNNNVQENQKMSEERAKALKEFFVKNGIDESFVTVKGMGNTDPHNPPPTEKRSKGKRYIGSTYIVITEL